MTRRPASRLVILAVALVGLGSCQLTPLYGGSAGLASARTIQGIDIAPVDGRAGYFVRQALIQRVGAARDDSPYRLVIKLDDDLSAFGIRGDSSATRERRTLRARYQLVDRASGLTVLDQTASGDAGIDVVSSEYATVAAEQTALERIAEQVANQIVSRLTLFVRRGAGEAAAR